MITCKTSRKAESQAARLDKSTRRKAQHECCTDEKEVAKLGSLEFSVKDEEKVAIPVWASIAGIAIGAGLLLFGNRKR
jgi:hypothetical protein